MPMLDWQVPASQPSYVDLTSEPETRAEAAGPSPAPAQQFPAGPSRAGQPFLSNTPLIRPGPPAMT